MKPPDKLTEKNDTLLTGPETLDLYLKEIKRNLGTMIGQAVMLETAIFEMKKQLREYIATEQPVVQTTVSLFLEPDLSNFDLEALKLRCMSGSLEPVQRSP